VFLGLHQYRFPSPSITCVRPGIAAAIPEFTALGIELAFAKTGDDCFNEIGFRDPAGQMVTVLEARTYFPTDRAPQQESLCGWFEAFSLPAADFAPCAAFWERLGYVAMEVAETPWLHQPLTGNGLGLALHRPRTLDRPTLVFSAGRHAGADREAPEGPVDRAVPTSCRAGSTRRATCCSSPLKARRS
jgi:hypothetical protein